MIRAAPLALLAACTITGPIDYDRAPPADWPALAEIHRTATPEEVARRCKMPRANGCAVANFSARTCTIYTSSDHPAVLAHERAHCAGYDHPGESSARDAWQRHKQRSTPTP